MKIHPISIKFIFIVAYVLISFSLINRVHSQGFNHNEWIFGYCEDGDNNYVSFGKDGEAKVKNIPEGITFGKGNSAMAIDPITGKTLFYTDGALVYNYLNEPMQGIEGELGGIETERQTVAISALDYATEEGGDKLFYIFFLNQSGELEYVIADMNDQGGAQVNQPPAGAISPGDILGPASGALAVVKAPDSPNYLISFEEDSLVAREIGTTGGEFLLTGGLPIDIRPKAIVFDEDSQTLMIVPSDLNQDLIQIPFNTSDGTFGTPVPLSQTGGGDPIEGASFSPEGAYVYYSQGDQLYRIPTSDPTAAPEEIPLETEIFKAYDVKAGPDDQIYYIYEETEGGPQLVGRITNPDEEDFDLIEWEEDPFNGTDFCGRIFPVFAPNIDLANEVDFSWEPQDPCMNNPLQLTSEITPANYQPVSFEWTINPPLTDEEGEEIEIDLDEEHLLLPADATSEQSVSVTLTVNFANGDTRDVTHSIPLTENNLQAQFSASDTTLCEPECIDLSEILEAQSGEEGGGGQQGGGQGGGIPGLPGGLPGGGGQQGGDQGGNYEYFWSNKKEEGWGPEAPNEVCLPGFYWVLVREQGSNCYAYASIRVKIWDVVDQSNNIWYFGNGAGLDFNVDPDNPEGPTPRPIENPHPQNIPAGVTTISDQAGEVLFYTDGQTVWDLNGNPMQNGLNIGGDNQSSQSVLAVPLPQEETLFYLFTTQTSAGGNQVKFSLVDIKGDNPDGVGNVVSSNNFLFSPSTEHAAALGSGDTTWVAFHELGNNTFRLYPVSSEGVGQPVFSSVGGNHDFGTGVGSMKFSPDGTKLAVTINEGGTNRVEIFDFDQATGELTEYALLDLGNQGEIYGLEFSNDGSRVFVSYQDGGPVEEFFIQATEATDDSDPDDPGTSTCTDCFENATTPDEIEQCILDSRATVPDTQDLPLGALQIGPNGQIYAAVVGSNLIGQIQVGQDCNPSSFNQNAVEAMPGPSNLGLPSFVQNSGSNIPDPSLAGPNRLCLDPEEGAVGVFEGGGEPDIDTYIWTITDEADSVVHSIRGLGEEFQTLEYSFPTAGTYTLELEVDRCGTLWEETFSMEVEVIAPPELTLQDDISLCSDNGVTLTAIEDYEDSEGLYTFEWTNAAGEVFPSTNSIEVTEESIYTVTVSHVNPGGEDILSCPATTSVFVGPVFEFEMTQTEEESCYEENYITFAPDTPVSGEWSYQLQGSTEPPTPLGEGFEIELNVETLPEAGLYDIIFITEDPILDNCLVEKRTELLVHPLPDFTIDEINPADCETSDGSFDILMVTDADSLSIEELPQLNFPSASAGEIIPLQDLDPGIYTITAELNGCSFTQTVNIENSNPPAGFDYEVSLFDEECGPDGVENGSIEIAFNDPDQSGTYVITREEDGSQVSEEFEGSISVPLRDGTYAVEVSGPDGCAVPKQDTYIITDKLPVNFTIPTETIGCEEFVFHPDPISGIEYSITDESGNEIPIGPDGNYVLPDGNYLVTGIDPNGDLCPRTREMTVTINPQVDFDVSDPVFDCNTGVRYRAELDANADPADYFYFWRNSLGDIIGRSQEFSPPQGGEYSLEVQPRAGAACPQGPISFTVDPFDGKVDVSLSSVSNLCSDISQTIILADFEMPANANIRIEWHKITNGTSNLLSEFNNMDEISVQEEGVYEVILINESFNQQCIVGNDQISILQSEAIPPILEPSYTICADEGVTATLDSLGNWSFYEWWLEDELLDGGSTFTPTLPGNYQLVVKDEAGCEFVVPFEVIEDCELKITFPNAMIPGRDDKNFLAYANEYIDEVEVLIYNRWGELIFHCAHENVEPASAFCQWDGIVNGKSVPIGTYPVLIRFKSKNQGIEKVLKEAIVVIE
ncbi:MAG: gliding motility-associated C-terminal domain-containing protein [Anditalea sp.]